MSPPPEKPRDPAVADGQQLVLLVDDDAATRMMMRKVLVREGFSVIEAENGRIALSLFDESRPAIVLLDVEMPVMDGFSTCRELRQRDAAEHLPILMVTGHEDLDSVNRAYEAGATDFISKPINWPSLGHRVRYMIRASAVMTDLAYAVRELDRSRDRLAKAQKIARLGSWDLDASTLDMSWSDEMHRIMDLRPDAVDPSLERFLELVHEDDLQQVQHWFSLVLKGGKAGGLSHRIVRMDGTQRSVQLQVEVNNDREGGIDGLCGTLQDVTCQQDYQEKIRQLAYFDTLTGLPNRDSFMLHVKQSIEMCVRHERKLAALFLDIDDFKRVNDVLGHANGDLLLKEVSSRLQSCMRACDVISRVNSDTACHIIARFGGDEFTILLSEINDSLDSVRISERILEALSDPVKLAGHEVVVTPSLGIALFPEDGASAEELIKNADTAMYCAKHAGKNRFQLYNEAMNASASDRLMLENQLRNAVEHDEFSLHYQPQMNLATGRIVGTEALLRWCNGQLGQVPPDRFIPLAESSGLIISIGEWVIRTACTQMLTWKNAGLPLERMAVNVSVRQFMDTGFVDLVARMLDETGLDPAHLELEITESLLMKDVEGAIRILESLKALGVELAIDDFGTGYSSLSYLKRFPIDRLKIDQAFVQDLTRNADDAAIIRAVTAMAYTMNLAVIAEGVETEEQLRYLEHIHCHEIQGYYLSHPLPAQDATSLLVEHFNPEQEDAEAG